MRAAPSPAPTTPFRPLDGTDGGEIILGEVGNDSIDVGGGDERLSGGTWDDTLLGSGGADNLGGGTGADILDGGAQDDVLRGGQGADLFIFRAGGGSDTIRDFVAAEDRILIDAPTGSELGDLLSAGQFSADGLGVTQLPGGGDLLVIRSASPLTVEQLETAVEVF